MKHTLYILRISDERFECTDLPLILEKIFSLPMGACKIVSKVRSTDEEIGYLKPVDN